MAPFVYTRNQPQTHAKRKLLIGASSSFQSSQNMQLAFVLLLRIYISIHAPRVPMFTRQI